MTGHIIKLKGVKIENGKIKKSVSYRSASDAIRQRKSKKVKVIRK